MIGCDETALPLCGLPPKKSGQSSNEENVAETQIEEASKNTRLLLNPCHPEEGEV